MLVGHLDGNGKSGAKYASDYAEENRISSDMVISSSEFGERWTRDSSTISAIVVVDDIAATGKSLISNFKKFANNLQSELQSVPIFVVTIVVTAEAEKFITSEFAKIPLPNLEFRSCEVLTDDCYAFPRADKIWESKEQEDRARALCTDLGSKIYRSNPLGYGDLGLLVVFPTTVPNNTLPLIHSHSKVSSETRWDPLFERIVN